MRRAYGSDREITAMKKVMSRYEQIVSEVHDLLATADGRARVLGRREHAKTMADGLRRWSSELKIGRMRSRGAVLTVTQGALEGALAQRALLVSVEVNGVRVGQIEFSPTHPPMFSATKVPASPPRSDLDVPLAWSGNARDGDTINAYLDRCRQGKSMPERDVQGQMNARFRALFDGDGDGDAAHKPRGGLVAVRPAGCMMEIPTAVAASKTLQLGNGAIDLMARSGRGRTSWFIACELKRYDSTERAFDVLVQAIRYTAAIDVEINGCGVLAPADAAIYRDLLGGSGTSRLRLGSLAAISVARRDEVTRAFAELAPPKSTWIGALLYEQDLGGLRATLVRSH